MVKKNVQNTEKVVEKPAEELNGAPAPGKTNEPQATQVGEETTTEDVQKELSGVSAQNSGEQTDNPESAELDSESEAETTGTKGNETDDPLTELKEKTERRNRIAKDVFKQNTNCKVLYFTSDLVPFFIESDAFRHGSLTLKDETIVTINRK